MANEIWTNYPESNTLYAIVHKKTNDEVLDFDGGTNAWEAWNDAGIDDYDIPMTDHDGDYYSVDFPAQVVTAGIYRVTIFNQVGVDPDADDDTSIAQGEIHWDGSAEMDTSTLDALIDAILLDTGTTIPATITTAQADLDIITGASGVKIDTDAVDADALKTDAVTEIFDAVSGANGDTLEDLSDQMDVLSAQKNQVLNVYEK